MAYNVVNEFNRFVRNFNAIDVQRSKFKRPKEVKTTFNAGKLIPLYCQEVLPGDSWSMDVASVIRSVTPAVPVMDNSYIDLYAFFVPNRLCTANWNDWQKITGENFNGAWAPTTESTIVNTGNSWDLAVNCKNGCNPQSVANYLGIPLFQQGGIKVQNLVISKLPFKGYLRIWNDWFRDQNVQTPYNSLIDTRVDGNFNDTLESSFYEADSCLPVNKFHDYFTSALPAPQKSLSPVMIPLLGEAPIVTSNSTFSVQGKEPVKFADVATGDLSTNQPLATGSFGNLNALESTEQLNGTKLAPVNLYADLAEVSGATINQLRLAFALQRLFETDARGGSRYYETLKSHFGCAPTDLTLMRPEYLGGKRFPLNITQVLQTSSSNGEPTPLGNTGAFSNTSDRSNLIGSKSFNEYGFVYVLACVRTDQTYSQGLSRMWTRNRRFDYYWPVFANLGEQPILKRELFMQGDQSDKVFGYQEAWADYRFDLNSLTGYFAANSGDKTLTKWTYSADIKSDPVLNADFMYQQKEVVDQTLAVTNSKYQYIGDFYFDVTLTRPMPLYSIPGLNDLR